MTGGTKQTWTPVEADDPGLSARICLARFTRGRRAGMYSLSDWNGRAREPFSGTPVGATRVLSQLGAEDVVVDVGAHVGAFAFAAARRGAVVRAYEPSPAAFAALRRNVVEAHQAVVAAAGGGTVEFYVGDGLGTSNSAIARDGRRGEVCAIRVSTVAYADAVAGATVIKLDVEGSEYELPIASAMPDRCWALLLAFHAVPGSGGQPPRDRVATILDDLTALGFVQVGHQIDLDKRSAFAWEGVWERRGMLLGRTEMSTTTTRQYAQLEARIRKGDLLALMARWLFGKKLLAERGDAKRLPNGRLEELAKALASSPAELKNRMQFAAEYPTRAAVADAFTKFGSWSEICVRGMGQRGGDWRTDMVPQVEAELAAQEAGRQDPVGTRLPRLGEAIVIARDEARELQKYVADDRLLAVDFRDMEMAAERLLACYEKAKAHHWEALVGGRDPGLLKFVA